MGIDFLYNIWVTTTCFCLSKIELKGLKSIDCSTKLDKKDRKKIKISKSSIYIAFGYLLCMLLYKKGVKNLNVNGG